MSSLIPTKKVTPGLTPTKKVLPNSVPEIQELPKSLNFTYNYLQSKIPGITYIQYENISPVLKKLDNLSNSSMFIELQDFGSKEQSDISRASNNVTSLNKLTTFSEVKSKFSGIIEKENKLFYMGAKSDKLILIKQFYEEILAQQKLNTASKTDLVNFKKKLIKDINDVVLYKDILILFTQEIQTRNIMTLEEMSKTILASRVVSFTNSLTVGEQLKGTIDILLDGIQNEQELSENYINVVHPAFMSLYMNNKSEFDNSVTKFLSKGNG